MLTGNTLQTIEGFEVTGTNYQQVVECLKHRYGRKRVVTSSLVKSVIKMDAKSSVSASLLRDLYDTLKNRTRALEALEETQRAMDVSCCQCSRQNYPLSYWKSGS